MKTLKYGMLNVLDKLFKDHARVGITGGPNTGKTTLAQDYISLLNVEVDEGRRDALSIPRLFHTDEYIDRGTWDEMPEIIKHAADPNLSPVLIEGCQVARAARDGLDIDVLLVLETSYTDLTDGQMRMKESVTSVTSKLQHLPIVRQSQISWTGGGDE